MPTSKSVLVAAVALAAWSALPAAQRRPVHTYFAGNRHDRGHRRLASEPQGGHGDVVEAAPGAREGDETLAECCLVLVRAAASRISSSSTRSVSESEHNTNTS